MSCKHKTRLARAVFARLVCLLHIGLSIFVLYNVKQQLIYLIPIVGALLIVVEAIAMAACCKCKEPIAWLSPLFFIYVATIVSSIWFLELENIKNMKIGQLIKDYNIYNRFSKDDITASIKVIWSQVEIQMFFAILIFVRWLMPKSHLSPRGLSELLFKYFAVACDMLDFLTIIQDNVLIVFDMLVYSTLAVWTWSTFQFFIYVPTYEDEEKREFNAYITNSLLSVIFLDMPYLCLRIIVIFAFGSHNYNSYFFSTKNIVMILLQIVRIKSTYEERRIRSNKYARHLKDQIGFDKEKQGLYNRQLDEIAIKNFEQKYKTSPNSAPATPLNSTRQQFSVPANQIHTDV
jgi:hypothetical protein